MTISICVSCTLPFVKTARSRMTECLPCWKQAQGYDLTKSDIAHQSLAHEFNSTLEAQKTMSKTITQLLSEIQSLKSQNQTPTSSTSLSPEFLKSLIMLCHPDKHSNSTLSTEVTKQLLAMRKK